jgi:hypothetical protein
MMQKTTFTCDLCGKEGTTADLVGFEFDPKNRLVQKHISHVHRHLHFDCLNNIGELYLEVRRNEKENFDKSFRT